MGGIQDGGAGAEAADVMHSSDPGSPAQMRGDMKRSTGGPRRGIEAARGKVGVAPERRQQDQGAPQDPKQEAQDEFAGGRPDSIAQTLHPQLSGQGIGMDGAVRRRTNPLMPLDTLMAEPKNMWLLAHHVGSAWNALVGGGAGSSEALGQDWAHLPEWKRLALRGMTGGGNNQSTPWMLEHVMPALLNIGANASMPTFALSMAGDAPTDMSKIPGYLSGVSGIAGLFSDFKEGPKIGELGWDGKLLWHTTQAAMTASMLRLHVAPAKIFGAAGFGEGMSKAFSELEGKVKPPMGVAPPEDVKNLAGSSPYLAYALDQFKQAPSERVLARAAAAAEVGKADALAQSHGFNDILHFTEQRTAAAGADAIARPRINPEQLAADHQASLAGDVPEDPQLLRRQKAELSKATAEMDTFNRVQGAHGSIAAIAPADLAELDKANTIPKDSDTARPRFDTSLLYGQKPADPAAARLWENRQADYFQQWKKYLGVKGLKPDQLRASITQQLQGEVKGARARLWQDEQARVKRLQSHLDTLSEKGPAISSTADLAQQANHGVLTDEQASYVQKHWKELDLPYDLKARFPDGRDIPDPRQTIGALPQNLQADGTRVLGTANALFKHLYTGPYGHSEDLMGSVYRSLVGGTRATKFVGDRYVKQMAGLLIHSGVKDYARLTDAIEGVPGAYDSLGPAEKLAADMHALLYGHIGDQHVASGRYQPTDLIPNYLPRVDRRIQSTGSRRGAAPATGASAVSPGRLPGHRAYTLETDDGGQLVREQRFGTVREANQEISRQRSTLAEDIRNKNPERSVAQVQNEVDRSLPLKETDYLNILSQSLSASINKIHAHQAVDILEHTIGEFTRKDGSKISAPLVWRSQGGNAGELGGQVTRDVLSQSRANTSIKVPAGYRAIDNFMPGVYFHPEFAGHVDKAIRFVGDNKKWHGASWKSFLDTENVAIRNIMYSPMIHAINVAHRATTLSIAHPVSMFSAIKGYHGLDKAAREEMWMQAEVEAIEGGLMPHAPHGNAFTEFNGKAMAATGDTEYMSPPGSLDQRQMSPWLKAKGAGSPIRLGQELSHGYSSLQSHFWGQVHNFGVLAYHVEKDASRAHGLDEVSSRLYAADRANMWMGAMRPEQWSSQISRDTARALMFAPNWWRTWMRLMTGQYDTIGVGTGPEMKQLWAKNEMKTLTAFLGVQKVSGNLLNYMGSGHFQNQNENGAQDKINISRLATTLNGAGKHMSASGLPVIKQAGEGLQGLQGSDPQTGGQLYIENPLGRQMQSTERAAGLQSGHPGWQPANAAQGLAETVVDRLSPLVAAITSFGNIDLHRTIYDGQLRHVDPHLGLGPNAGSILQGAADLTPFGYPLSYNIERDLSQGKDPVGPWGSHIPNLLSETIKNVPLGAEMAALTAFTGIIPPYIQAEKTAGTKPADNQLVQYGEAKAKHEQQTQNLWGQLMAGAIDPATWLSEHRQSQTKYDDMVQNTWGHGGNYVTGNLSLVSNWEKTYTDATDKETGQLDYNRLATLQQQYRSSLTQDQRTSLQTELHKNDFQNPGTKMYHDAVQSYRDFQGEASKTLGVDEATLHQASLDSYKASKDPAANAAFTQQHPYMRQYARLKSQWETTSWAGLLYGMYYDTNAVSRWIKAHGGNSVIDRVVQTNAQSEGFK